MTKQLKEHIQAGGIEINLGKPLTAKNKSRVLIYINGLIKNNSQEFEELLKAVQSLIAEDKLQSVSLKFKQ